MNPEYHETVTQTDPVDYQEMFLQNKDVLAGLYEKFLYGALDFDAEHRLTSDHFLQARLPKETLFCDITSDLQLPDM